MKKTMKITVGVAVAMLAVVGLHYYKDAHKKVELVEEIDEVEKADPVGPVFNADSAYAFTKAQCDFGPRNMNSWGHDLCGEWIVNKFREYGCKVTTQRANLTGYDGTTLRSCNIMASINPEATTRILLCAHWDSRPWADNDPDQSNWKKPIIAANDAASGVAVMLELARIINNGKAERHFARNWGSISCASTPKIGAHLNGLTCRMMQIRGHLAHNTGARTCHRATKPAMVSC